MEHSKTLHILNKGPEHARTRTCLSALGPNDELLLIENGALCLAKKNLDLDCGRIYVIEADLAARGLSDQNNNAQPIDYATMVALTAEAENIISW